MNFEALLKHFQRLNCVPDTTGTYYSPSLIRCGCGRHAMAAASCDDEPGRATKLFGAALSWYAKAGKSGPLTYVIGKDPDGDWEKAVEAVHALKPASIAVQVMADFEPVPAGKRLDLSSKSWVQEMVLGRQRSLPDLAKRIESLVRPLGFKWYRSVTGAKWSGRLSGLQVCTLGEDGKDLVFSVGKTGKPRVDSGKPNESRARQKFLQIIEAHPREFGLPDANGALKVDGSDLDRALRILSACAESKLPYFGSSEHLFESRVLSGDLTLKADGEVLQVVEEPYPFQFPARWWTNGRPRYVDVLARQGATPWVVELKVDRGQGAYVRDGIVQTALYREYVLQSDGLGAWFNIHGMTRRACKAALVVPPFSGAKAGELRADHARVAAELSVVLVEDPAAVGAQIPEE